MKIDIKFDFRSDTPPGKDPDAHSTTLRRYHKHLWNKALPCGKIFTLEYGPRNCLLHRSDLGQFFLSSDSAIPTYTKWRIISAIIDQIPYVEREEFIRLSYTIGGMILFPKNRIGKENTINGARGFHPLIKDRFDLTVECIRRFYLGEASPLADTLARYADFFRLFKNFRGYVEFFLLQDMVSEDYSSVKFFIPFSEFNTAPLPSNLATYLDYRERASLFIESRNQRILKYSRFSSSS
ncbi:hypothetical protein Q8A64_14875 [Oxalobacteraceae bacterium R-40]|uniref:Uncharacterized protein n=1 Tax=Keguizhuia sedimenti TaxID=3064264 RepID=A0ABU1BRP9_9BURK|nr:hypothetical protein [Oxalobacteraceae bacterium R-40]